MPLVGRAGKTKRRVCLFFCNLAFGVSFNQKGEVRTRGHGATPTVDIYIFFLSQNQFFGVKKGTFSLTHQNPIDSGSILGAAGLNKPSKR